MKNRRIIIEQPGIVNVEDCPMPVPAPGEALLKMHYGGICGSDLNSYRGAFAYVSYPRTPGHELSAEIVDVPKNNLGLKRGMMVTVNPYFNCGACYSCRRGLVNCCTTNQTMGVQREGGFAQYISIPMERLYDAKGIPAPTLALIEPFAISYHGVNRAQVKKGEKVLIVGSGTIGVLAALAAKIYGAEVYMCDVAQNKLQLAQSFGVDGVILNEGPESMAAATEKITGGDGFDVVIEAVGLPSTFQDCIDASAFGGRVVLIGVGNENLDFNFTLLQKKELQVYGSRNAVKADFLALIDAVSKGEMDLEKIVTNEYSFEDAPKAFADFDANAASMLKVRIAF